MNVPVKLGAAATRLCHLTAAVAMHGAAAGPFFVRHGSAGHTGEHRCCRYKQQQDRNEAEKTTHQLTICPQVAFISSGNKGLGSPLPWAPSRPRPQGRIDGQCARLPRFCIEERAVITELAVAKQLSQHRKRLQGQCLVDEGLLTVQRLDR